MGNRTTWLGIATSVTALDAAVVTYYGGVVWRALSLVIWGKLLLILLAAIWVITLLHVWVYACFHLRQTIQGHQVVVSISADTLSAEFAEEIDV